LDVQVGVVDLGPLGAALVRQLHAGGHRCVVFDRSPRLVGEFVAEKARGAASVMELVSELDPPRAIWLAGPVVTVDAMIADLLPHLEAGDTIVNCTNSHYVDDIGRATALGAVGIHYVDVGISGGLERSDRGHCLTVGGEPEAVRRLEPLFRQLAAVRGPNVRNGGGRGYLHCGPAGAGHFVKMIHDGIERSIIAAYAEGFSILRAANVRRGDRGIEDEDRRVIHPEQYQYDFSLSEIAEVWRHGSDIASRVLDMGARALAKDATLRSVSGRVPSTREDWLAVRAAVDEGVLVPVLASAMYLGLGAREEREFGNRLLTAIHEESGRHTARATALRTAAAGSA
jgi:6-phosphogluconate dehydrogenase